MVIAFDKLSICERANLLWKEGKLIASITHHNRKIVLYSFQEQFFEMWYDVGGILIDRIIPMSKPELFKQYIQI